MKEQLIIREWRFKQNTLRMNDNFTDLTITSVEVARLKQGHCKEKSYTFHVHVHV